MTGGKKLPSCGNFPCSPESSSSSEDAWDIICVALKAVAESRAGRKDSGSSRVGMFDGSARDFFYSPSGSENTPVADLLIEMAISEEADKTAETGSHLFAWI